MISTAGNMRGSVNGCRSEDRRYEKRASHREVLHESRITSYVVQSMTNTDTADIASTAQQCFELAQAGSELVAHHRERAGSG